MADFPPAEADDVVSVASRQVDADHRSFELEGSPSDEEAELPDLSEIQHEADLVAAMKQRGYRLTMVGGGAGTDELRRFYFRTG